MTLEQEVFLKLIRIAIGTEDDARIPSDVNWDALLELADMQGFAAIVLDGLQMASERDESGTEGFGAEGIGREGAELEIPANVKYQMFGDSLLAEENYKHHCEVMASLARMFKKADPEVRTMIVKGYELSLNYPKPNHRALGDIDMWLFGKDFENKNEVGDLVVERKGIKVDRGHHHHSVFVYKGVTIENYTDFLCVPGHATNQKYENMLKKLAVQGMTEYELNGEKVYFPGQMFNALFVLRHTATHFAATCMTVRQLVDWALLVKKYSSELDWDYIKKVVSDFKMVPFFEAQNAICVEYLGLPKDLFPEYKWDAESKALADRVLMDTLSPEFNEEKVTGIKAPIFKFRRWWANGWKHKMVFPESQIAAFVTQLVAHIQKPKTLIS